MIRAKALREALATVGLAKIDDATFHVHMTAVNAWGPSFEGEIVVRRRGPLRSVEPWEERRTIALGGVTVRNGYTDAGRRYVQRGEDGAAYSRWEHWIDSHGSEAIYLPETAAIRLDRCQLMSLYACAGACDELQFQLWFDAATSSNLIEANVHGDVLSAMCGQDPGRMRPGWEHTIETRVGPHNVARAGAAGNIWPSVRRTMEAVQKAMDRGRNPEGVALERKPGLYDSLLAKE